jgi:hypothetical protein
VPFKTRPLTKRHLENTTELKLVFEHGEVLPNSSIVVHKDDEHKKAIISAVEKASNETTTAFNGFHSGHESEVYIEKIKKGLTK